jgi:hypothetical protein
MKVKEFIAVLSEHDPEAEIIISQDPEGNGFAPVDDVDSVLYSLTGQGDVYDLKDRETLGENAINAVVLYPLDNYSLKKWQREQLNRKYS